MMNLLSAPSTGRKLPGKPASGSTLYVKPSHTTATDGVYRALSSSPTTVLGNRRVITSEGGLIIILTMTGLAAAWEEGEKRKLAGSGRSHLPDSYTAGIPDEGKRLNRSFFRKVRGSTRRHFRVVDRCPGAVGP